MALPSTTTSHVNIFHELIMQYIHIFCDQIYVLILKMHKS